MARGSAIFARLAQVRRELEPLLGLKGQPEAIAKLDELTAKVTRRLQAKP